MALNGVNGRQTQVTPANGTSHGTTTSSVNAKPHIDLGGIEFSKGLLKDIEVQNTRSKNSEGIFETYKLYKATLSDGTTVTYSKQPDGGAGGIDANTAPRILQNKDGSIDFIGLNLAAIEDSPNDDNYNLIGCSFTDVFLTNNGNDKDKVDFANIKDSNGNTVKNSYNTVFFNKGDEVASPINPEDSPKTQSYSGYISSLGDNEMKKCENLNPLTSLTRIQITKDGETITQYEGGTFYERAKESLKDKFMK